MKAALGEGYVNSLRKIHGDVPESCDFVMYWWNQAANLARSIQIERLGFITTNSIKQTFNRKVLESYLRSEPTLSIRFAIPDHPWIDAGNGAAVRIAMTTAEPGRWQGDLLRSRAELT